MKNILLIAILMIAGSISYYYAIELPRENRQRLALEEKKYADEQTAKQTAKQDDESNHEFYLTDINVADSEKAKCEDEATKHYNDNLKANGTPDPDHKGYYSGSRDMFKNIEEQEEAEKKACDVEFQREVEMAKSRWKQK